MLDGTGTLPITGDTAAVIWIKTGGDQGQPEPPGGNHITIPHKDGHIQ